MPGFIYTAVSTVIITVTSIAKCTCILDNFDKAFFEQIFRQKL